MSRVPDPALRLQWQRRLRKFHAFHGSVRQFCYDEEVSVASFYQWRTKLTEVRNSTKNKTNAALQNTIAAHFVPLQLAEPTPRDASPTQAAIVLPGGTRIELPSEDSPLIQAVIRWVMHEDAKLLDERRELAVDKAGGLR
ncbi:MAG: hypothetical protein O3C40_07170 [Planctomycetota bacterium]|nr:hypothetical protein [Planctomycetota bacterium]